MAKTDFKNVVEYHDTFTGETRERLEAIRRIIQTAVPEAEEVISYQIPAYKYKGAFLIYYSGYAAHVSLSSPFTEALLKTFENELKSYKVSKSAIQLPHKNQLPLDLLQKIILFRKKEIDENPPKKKS